MGLGQLLRKTIRQWLHFVNVLRKQSSNIGGAKTTGKTFRKEVVEEEIRVDEQKQSPKDPAIGRKSFPPAHRME